MLQLRPGYIIKLLRVGEGISQTALAEELGVTRSYLSQVEKERKLPALPFLQKVSQRFEIPLPLLLVEEGEAGEDDLAILSELQGILAKVLAAKVALTGKREGKLRQTA
jgi:transcriptional regulator with XRE-family HTH domain